MSKSSSYIHQYRDQALADIQERVTFLSSLQDGQGRNVQGFSAMRAVGRYVVHGIISETEFAMAFLQAYQNNGLLREIGQQGFQGTVRRALDGCQNDPLPKLRKASKAPTPAPFNDSALIAQGFHLNTTYQFFDDTGTPIFQKLRYHRVGVNGTTEKRFLVRHQVGEAWMSGRGCSFDVPYNLPHLMSNKTDRVFVCEGEKDADTATSLGVLAVSVSNWIDCASYFKDRDVVIVPDHDEAGQKAAQRAREALQAVARTLSIVTLAGLGPKQDLTDWVEQGGTVQQLLALVEEPVEGPRRCYALYRGVPINNRANISLGLKRLNIDLSYNQLTDGIELSGLEGYHHLNDFAANRLRMDLCEREGFKVTKSRFDESIVDIAHGHAFHPIKTYLSQLQWDGVGRVDRFFVDICGAEDTPLIRRITQIWFTAAVRRVFEPGADFQELVVLEGEQGKGKSTTIRNLCPDPKWFSDDLPLNASSKVIVEHTLGKWIIEASELTGSQQDPRTLKRFLSATTDRARLSYDRFSRDFPRQWIAIGTTNETEYLIDSTGNRRFWPIQTGQFDLDRLTPDYRDQLWAEAYSLHKDGLSIKLDKQFWSVASDLQDQRRTVDPWEELLTKLLPEGSCSILVTSVLEALHVPSEKQDRRASIRVGYIMRKLGFKKTSARHPVTQRVVKSWVRGESRHLQKLTFSGVSDF